MSRTVHHSISLVFDDIITIIDNFLIIIIIDGRNTYYLIKFKIHIIKTYNISSSDELNLVIQVMNSYIIKYTVL